MISTITTPSPSVKALVSLAATYDQVERGLWKEAPIGVTMAGQRVRLPSDPTQKATWDGFKGAMMPTEVRVESPV
jgi:hypothetical protein